MSDSCKVLDYDAQSRVQPNDLIVKHYRSVSTHEQQAVFAQKRRVSERSGRRCAIEFLDDPAVRYRDGAIKATSHLINRQGAADWQRLIDSGNLGPIRV
jgi:hypothetical protein